MVFGKDCSVKSLHPEGLGQLPLQHGSKLPAPLRDYLVQQAGILELSQKLSSKVRKLNFCTWCINFGEEVLRANAAEASTRTSVHNKVTEEEVEEISSGFLEKSSATEKCMVISVANIDQDVASLSSEERAMLALAIGKCEREQLRANALCLTKSRSLSNLMDLSAQDFIKQMNPVLLNFLIGLCPEKTVMEKNGSIIASPNNVFQKPSDAYKLVKVAESCMSLTAPISVLPFHFREIVLIYSFTRSRIALSVLGSGSPCGSYQAVKSWLAGLPCETSKLHEDRGDCMAVFDNNQVMRRRWQITVANSVKCSVVTMVVYLELDKEGRKEFTERLKPSNWMWHLPPDALKRLHDQGDSATKLRYSHNYYPWLSSIIEEVAKEQKERDGNHFTDSVDAKVSEVRHAKEYKTCPNCQDPDMPKRARICRQCNVTITSARLKQADSISTKTDTSAKSVPAPSEVRVQITKTQDSGSDAYKVEYLTCKQSQKHQYHHLGDRHPATPPEISIGAPIFVNPCSYAALASVFRGIGKEAGIKAYGGNRSWLLVMCDGVPYVLGLQLIEKMYRCLKCSTIVLGDAEKVSHQDKVHGKIHVHFEKEFDWIVLQPGPGHIEMNMLKSYVKLVWNVFWEDMVEVFGFKSENAKIAAQKVNDHHKGMTLARIARESFAKELVLPYVREQLAVPEASLSVVGFTKWCMKNVANPNYAFCLDSVLELLDSIFAYRAGLRTGFVPLMKAGRDVFAKVWCARLHPMYRQLEAYDSLVEMCMPQEVKELADQAKSFQLKSIPFTGEGGDFKMEEVNKAIQHWLPAAPAAKDWEAACSNYKQLQKLRETVLRDMSLNDPKERTARPTSDISAQVLAFRALLRDREYISDPRANVPHTSLGGKPLDPKLVSFNRIAGEKRKVFCTSFVKHFTAEVREDGSVPYNEPPVFVTLAEREEYEDIKKRTISEIIEIIKCMIAEIGDNSLQESFMSEFEASYVNKRGKKRSKQEYLDFHSVVQEFLDMQTCDIELPDDDLNDV